MGASAAARPPRQGPTPVTPSRRRSARRNLTSPPSRPRSTRSRCTARRDRRCVSWRRFARLRATRARPRTIPRARRRHDSPRRRSSRIFRYRWRTAGCSPCRPAARWTPRGRDPRRWRRSRRRSSSAGRVSVRAIAASPRVYVSAHHAGRTLHPRTGARRVRPVPLVFASLPRSVPGARPRAVAAADVRGGHRARTAEKRVANCAAGQTDADAPGSSAPKPPFEARRRNSRRLDSETTRTRTTRSGPSRSVRRARENRRVNRPNRRRGVRARGRRGARATRVARRARGTRTASAGTRTRASSSVRRVARRG